MAGVLLCDPATASETSIDQYEEPEDDDARHGAGGISAFMLSLGVDIWAIFRQRYPLEGATKVCIVRIIMERVEGSQKATKNGKP